MLKQVQHDVKWGAGFDELMVECCFWGLVEENLWKFINLGKIKCPKKFNNRFVMLNLFQHLTNSGLIMVSAHFWICGLRD